VYYCTICGSHQYVALAQAFKDAWNAALKALPDAQIPQGYPCPAGHGDMKQLQAEDRIYVRPASIEKIVPIEEDKG
jgi:hypothetical protein